MVRMQAADEPMRPHRLIDFGLKVIAIGMQAADEPMRPHRLYENALESYIGGHRCRAGMSAAGHFCGSVSLNGSSASSVTDFENDFRAFFLLFFFCE